MAVAKNKLASPSVAKFFAYRLFPTHNPAPSKDVPAPAKVPEYRPFPAHNPAPKKELPMPTRDDIQKARGY